GRGTWTQLATTVTTLQRMQDGITVRGVHIPDAELDWRFTGAGGPGGQHANTSNTAAELRFDVEATAHLPDRLKQRIRRRLGHRITASGVLVVKASEHRSQHRNRTEALSRMSELLDEGIAPPAKPRRPTRPSRSAKRRRLEGKKRRGALKAGRQNKDWD
ncbi:MAG TPA: alternative ribosome rescue aminoacyl-tRNA hydrolase ArfB, partial [Euzebya sp.]|nr:alternative ribosome rescue aminoacyl-tRNA hydrolase ArfB [Euzebya sp.]